ncbi:MAG TPA: M48 family metalloprotease [Candidatus Acidoferrales bacterium]|jgi:heat shock protein HtpX|nr:M48 family metalloprotease [Candidatus Acidoferrales bacterium]
MYHQIAANRRKSVLVIFLFFLFWIAAGYGIGLLAGAGALRGAVTGAVIAGLLALVAVLWALTMGQITVLAASGAKPVTQQQYPQLYDVVSTLTIGSGLPMPKIYVIDDPSPNAFATGLSPKSAAVTATTGLLQIMNREELEGVLGHEMSHIRNYDVRLVLIVSTVVALAGLLASIMWRSLFFTRVGNNRDGGYVIIILIAAAALLSVIAVIVGPLMQFALSRSRESLADASSVELTRNPAGLLHALQKLQKNDKPFAKMTHVTAAMCIDDPLQHHDAWFHHLFDTHPPIEQRIAALQRIMSAQET